MADSTFNHNMFNLVLQFAKDAAPDVDAEELLIFLKAGKSAQVKSVIDRFGRLFVEEFRHFMKLNSFQTAKHPVKLSQAGPSTGVGQRAQRKASSEDDAHWHKNSQKKYREDSPKGTH